MIDFVFEVFGAISQLMFVAMGLIFFAIGAGMTGFPIWQRLKYPRVKARIVELWADASPVNTAGSDDGQGNSGIEWKKEFATSPGKAVAGVFVLLLFAAIPLTFIGIGVYHAADYIGLKSSGIHAQGRVIEITSYTDSEGDTSYAPVVEFADRSGVMFSQKSRISSGDVSGFRVGDTVPVIYDENDPSHFLMDYFFHNMIVSIVVIAMGSLFLVIIYYALIRRGRPRKPSDARKKKFQALYYPVYEYITPDGRMVRAQMKDASAWVTDNVPGTERMISLQHDNYDQPCANQYMVVFFGMIFLTPGVLILSEALPQLEPGLPLLVAVVGIALFLTTRLARTVDIQALWRKKDSIREYIRAKSNKPAVVKGQKNSFRGVLLNPEDVQRCVQDHDRTMIKWTPVYLLIAAAMLWTGAHFYNKQASFERKAANAQGQVIRLISKTDNDGTTYYAMVGFAAADGAQIEFKDSIGSNPPSFSEGDRVDVLYDPALPQDAIIDRGWFNLLPSAALALVGGLWFLYSVKWFLQSLSRRGRRN